MANTRLAQPTSCSSRDAQRQTSRIYNMASLGTVQGEVLCVAHSSESSLDSGSFSVAPMADEYFCPLCIRNLETSKHLLRECEFSKLVWSAISH
jgi:hypothetical protein